VANDGSSKPIEIAEVGSWSPAEGLLWLHFDIRDYHARDWIRHQSGLSEVAINTLLSEETRPHVWREQDTVVMALRGINFNPDAEPEDMVAVRIYADHQKIITTRRRSLKSLRELAARLEAGLGPSSVAAMLAELTGQLTSQLLEAIEALEDKMDGLEEIILDDVNPHRRLHVMELRRRCILLRRYLAPQREALARLYVESFSWINERARMQQRNIADQLVRYVETLDSVKDRAAVVQEEITSRAADQLNTRMYILSLVAALFLPLSFILSLFNLHIGGAPLTEHSFGVAALGSALVLAVSTQVIVFKRKGWF
jgi:zinc transporter